MGQVEIPVDQAAQAVHEEQEVDEGVALSTPPPEVSQETNFYNILIHLLKGVYLLV